MGFSGNDKITGYINSICKTSLVKGEVEMIFNLIIFVLFVNVILEMVFATQKKESDCDRAIIQLASFINEIDDISEDVDDKKQSNEVVREKYSLLQGIIPGNSDSEYRKAISLIKANNRITPFVVNENELQKELIKIIKSDHRLFEILSILHRISRDLYLTGGQIRNTIWDNVSNLKSDFTADDVDVIYFKSEVQNLEQTYLTKLKNENASILWSVKNQYFIHVHNNDEQYESLNAALSAFPDTASAIAIRKTNVSYEIITPYGLRDAFYMYVIPTQHIILTGNKDKYINRIENKKWRQRWPLLKVIDIPRD